ncbi:MAG: serine hydrolase domain-containing protein [Pseudomonadota bacterium]
MRRRDLLASLGALAATPAQAVETLQGALDRIVKAQAIPGATAALVIGDGAVTELASGFANIEAGQRMPADALMPAASIGKTFVAAWALALEREGKVDLDAPISRWFGAKPWFARLPNGPAITIRMLLNHTSGLIDHAWNPAYLQAFFARTKSDPDNIFTPEELVAFVLDRPPLFVAGKGYNYSDTNFILAGMIFEQAAGAGYYDEIRRRFFQPLGLARTVSSDRRSYPGLVNGYLREADGMGLPETSFVDGALFVNPGVEFTGGGVMSTSGDLVRWGRALFGGRAVNGPYLPELLATPDIPPHKDGKYGLGVMIRKVPGLGLSWGHSGTMPYYGSVLAHVPARRLTLAIMVNRNRFDRAPALAALARAAGPGTT